MNGLSDQELLREYAECRSESAFAELVARHVDLVHSAAARMVRDEHLAQDVAQKVFLALAEDAGKLARHPVLCGWLHQTTRNLAAKTIRSEVNRRAREQEVAAMNELLSAESETSWDEIKPHVDAALGDLDSSDRDAVMLRYFQSKSAREIGTVLGISEEAAQKRVHRALDRLRTCLGRRGVAAGAGSLVAGLSAHAVQAAPAGLANSISGMVLAGSGACAVSVPLAGKVLAMTTAQKLLVSAVTAVVLGAGLYQAREAARLRVEARALGEQRTNLLAELHQARGEAEAAGERLAAAERESRELKAALPLAEVLKRRGEVARWRSAANDPDAAAIKTTLDKVERLKQRLEQAPGQKIPELALLADKDWFDMVKGGLSSEDEYRWAFAGLRHTAQQKFAPRLQGAMRGYIYANQGRLPTNLLQVVPFFKPPMDASFVEGWRIVPGKDHGDGDVLMVTQRSAVDKQRESRVFLTPLENSWELWNEAGGAEVKP
jgi:RNA polymerase sigma factor (sigma-70 family)